MGELSARNFGLLIAYILPGFVAVWGLSLECEPLRVWLSGPIGEGPSLAGIPYVLAASIGAGMTASGVRWAVLDTLHHRTGIPSPKWNDARLIDRLPVYQFFIEIHYRYYQFYANSLVAGLFSYTLWRWHSPCTWECLGADAAFASLAGVFYAGSRDTLRKYYSRTAALLGELERQDSHDQRRTAHQHQDPAVPEVSTQVPHRSAGHRPGLRPVGNGQTTPSQRNLIEVDDDD